MNVTRLAHGVYRVEHDGRADLVYIAGPVGDRWAFANGDVYHVAHDAPRRRAQADTGETLMAPMPATVLKVFVEPGAAVKAGDTLVILEAMKMELPLRAATDGRVSAVRCREGDLVQPDTVLVEIA
jgi:biotin carboxyl carrier protein